MKKIPIKKLTPDELIAFRDCVYFAIQHRAIPQPSGKLQNYRHKMIVSLLGDLYIKLAKKTVVMQKTTTINLTIAEACAIITEFGINTGSNPEGEYEKNLLRKLVTIIDQKLG